MRFGRSSSFTFRSEGSDLRRGPQALFGSLIKTHGGEVLSDLELRWLHPLACMSASRTVDWVRDGGLVGGGGGEWVAGCDLGQSSSLLQWCSAVASGGALVLPCFSGHLPDGSSPIFRLVKLRCSSSGDKPQSTWRLFGGSLFLNAFQHGLWQSLINKSKLSNSSDEEQSTLLALSSWKLSRWVLLYKSDTFDLKAKLILESLSTWFVAKPHTENQQFKISIIHLMQEQRSLLDKLAPLRCRSEWVSDVVWLECFKKSLLLCKSHFGLSTEVSWKLILGETDSIQMFIWLELFKSSLLFCKSMSSDLKIKVRDTIKTQKLVFQYIIVLKYKYPKILIMELLQLSLYI
ncbi:hypothetical protein Bca4012_017655 [Brassica carinata]|uniref:Uncharacterized protein n=1 Tax=Brassica carinata TaxID=52824 RepID=A0A8X7WPP4_BRACI|nr:hypothetical protein Bca52824_003910 [Brassica carinata]